MSFTTSIVFSSFLIACTSRRNPLVGQQLDRSSELSSIQANNMAVVVLSWRNAFPKKLILRNPVICLQINSWNKQRKLSFKVILHEFVLDLQLLSYESGWYFTLVGYKLSFKVWSQILVMPSLEMCPWPSSLRPFPTGCNCLKVCK